MRVLILSPIRSSYKMVRFANDISTTFIVKKELQLVCPRRVNIQMTLTGLLTQYSHHPLVTLIYHQWHLNEILPGTDNLQNVSELKGGGDVIYCMM